MAGLFFSYSCSVMPGLSRLDDYQYLLSMQSINREIQNFAFFTVFFGVLLALPIATWLKYTQAVAASFWFLLAATLIYFVGVFLVTALGNIPLNDALDKLDLAALTKGALGSQRQLFEDKWVNLNLVRTVCSFLSFVCSLLAFLSGAEGTTSR